MTRKEFEHVVRGLETVAANIRNDRSLPKLAVTAATAAIDGFRKRFEELYKEKTESPSQLIPLTQEIYDTIRDYVKKHQEGKGYIDTQDPDAEQMNTFIHMADCFERKEMRIHGVRVNPETNDIEMVYDSDVNRFNIRYTYTDEDFKSPEAKWTPIDHEDVCYEHTLYAIANCIEQF